MSFKIYGGQKVFISLRSGLSPHELVGCLLDDGVSEQAWKITSINDDGDAFQITQGSVVREYLIAALPNGNLEIPENKEGLLGFLDAFAEEQRIAGEQRIAEKQQRIADEQQRIAKEELAAREQKFRPIIERRGIKSLFHFTRLENLPSILERGLLPQQDNEDVEMMISDQKRFDGRLDCVSLSISFPNSEMFYLLRIKRYPDSTWCVISLKPDILWSIPCLFFSHNAAKFPNAYRPSFRTSEIFEGLFRGDTRPNSLPAALPTNVQTEVQAEKPIPLEMFSGLHFENYEALSQFKSLSISLPNHINLSSDHLFFDDRNWILNR
jgi:hypothetical protein